MSVPAASVPTRAGIGSRSSLSAVDWTPSPGNAAVALRAVDDEPSFRGDDTLIDNPYDLPEVEDAVSIDDLAETIALSPSSAGRFKARGRRELATKESGTMRVVRPFDPLQHTVEMPHAVEAAARARRSVEAARETANEAGPTNTNDTSDSTDAAVDPRDEARASNEPAPQADLQVPAMMRPVAAASLPGFRPPSDWVQPTPPSRAEPSTADSTDASVDAASREPAIRAIAAREETPSTAPIAPGLFEVAALVPSPTIVPVAEHRWWGRPRVHWVIGACAFLLSGAIWAVFAWLLLGHR